MWHSPTPSHRSAVSHSSTCIIPVPPHLRAPYCSAKNMNNTCTYRPTGISLPITLSTQPHPLTPLTRQLRSTKLPHGSTTQSCRIVYPTPPPPDPDPRASAPRADGFAAPKLATLPAPMRTLAAGRVAGGRERLIDRRNVVALARRGVERGCCQACSPGLQNSFAVSHLVSLAPLLGSRFLGMIVTSSQESLHPVALSLREASISCCSH